MAALALDASTRQRDTSQRQDRRCKNETVACRDTSALAYRREAGTAVLCASKYRGYSLVSYLFRRNTWWSSLVFSIFCQRSGHKRGGLARLGVKRLGCTSTTG